MPDLMNQLYHFCMTAKSWGTYVDSSNGERKYKVAWQRTPPENDAQYDWICECPSHRMKKPRKLCKHIQQVRSLSIEEGGRCGWHQFLDGGTITEEGTCPQCDGPVDSEYWRV